MKKIYQLLIVASLYLNLLLMVNYFQKPFVPTYPVVKTVYDRAQDQAYRDGFLMTEFAVSTSESLGAMYQSYIGTRAYFPDTWCFDPITDGSEKELAYICDKYWKSIKI